MMAKKGFYCRPHKGMTSKNSARGSNRLNDPDWKRTIIVDQRQWYELPTSNHGMFEGWQDAGPFVGP